MTAAELAAFLLAHPDLPVAIDVDDGCKANYRDVVGHRVITGPLGDTFIALHADFEEENKGRR